jgi:hypothetical protein
MERKAEDLNQNLNALRAELDELVRSLPQHSVKPSQMMRIEDLEDAIAEVEAALARLNSSDSP